jgi:hypothetical protein
MDAAFECFLHFCSGWTDEDFFDKPFALKTPPLRGGDYALTLHLLQVVEQDVGGNKPTVLSRQSLHKVAESGIQFIVLEKAAGEVGIHHACAPFLFETVLVRLAEALVERMDIMPVSKRKGAHA